LRAVAGAVIEVGVNRQRCGGGSQAFAERGELAAAVVAVAQAQVVGQRGQRQAAEGIVVEVRWAREKSNKIWVL
jgi:hypothetical protein